MHEAVIVVAKYFVAIPVLVFLYVLWCAKGPRRKRLIITLVSTLIFSALLAKLAAMIHNDPRPFMRDGVTPYFAHGNDNGFPSDHTTYSTVIAWAVFTQSKLLGTILLVIALLIGGARVAAGVHHGQDIVAGFAIATLGYCLSGLLIRTITRHRHKTVTED